MTTAGGAYTPGLKVVDAMSYTARRLLPIPGTVLVNEGDLVDARQVVAETFMPGDITPLNVAKLLSMPPGDVPDCMLKKAGDRIGPGEPLARTKGIFGKFRTECKCETTGTIESISEVTGQVILRGAPQPVQVKAYLTGRVIQVIPNEGCAIEADVTFVQGIFGIGGETFGPIRMACKSHDQEFAEDLITQDLTGCVAVGGARVTAQTIERARKAGVSAIIAGGIDDADLEAVLGYNLGVAITGSERVGLTIIITEGFGEIAMARRTFELLASHEGDEAAVNGTTQIRAGVMRPEIVIPLKADRRVGAASAATEGRLAIGAPVRVIRDPYFGLIGRVTALPSEPQTLQSGSRARVLEVTFESSESAIIPRANVELIEGAGAQVS